MSPPGNAAARRGATGRDSRGGRGDEWNVPQALRDRRDAALRLAPFTDLWGLPGRDPHAPERLPEPSAYGLRRHELRAEVERRMRDGWASWELLERFANPATVAA